MDIAQVGDYLRDKLKEAGPATTSVYTGTLPGLDKSGIALQAYESTISRRHFGNFRTLYYPAVRVLIRGLNYPEASEMCNMVVSVLDGYHDTELTVTLLGTPLYLGQTEQQLHEFQELFQVILL